MAGNDLLLKILITASDETGGATRTAVGNINTIESAAKRVAQVVAGYLSFRVVVSGAEEFIKLGDQATLLSSRLKLATKSQEDFNRAEQQLFDVAQQTRTPLEAVYDLFAMSNKVVQDLGKSQNDSITLSQLVTQSFKLSGATAAESSQGIRQFVQGLQSGVVRGDEFNTVMEAAPRLAQALADGLQIPTNNLRGMAEQGKLTSKVVIEAVLGQAPQIAAEYAQMGHTVEGSLTQMENALLRYVGQVNGAHTVTTRLADGITYLSEHVDDLAQIGEVLVDLLAVKLVKGMTTATASMIANTSAVNAKRQADQIAALEAKNLLAVQQTTLMISAKLAAVEVQATKARLEEARAADQQRQAALATAKAEAEATAAIQSQIEANRAAVIAARERLAAASASMSQGVVAAEAELAAAVEAEGRTQLTAAEATKAHANALARLEGVEASATLATKELAAAESAHGKALSNNRSASEAAQSAMKNTSGAAEGMSKAAKLGTLAVEALSAALIIPIAIDVGKTIGEWADQFERVRVFGAYASNIWSGMRAEWSLLKGELTWSQYLEETQILERRLETVKGLVSEASLKQINAQQAIAEATKAQQKIQQDALTATQEKLKDGTKILEDEFSRQSEIQTQALQARLAKIAASGKAENIIAQQSAEVERSSLTQRLTDLEAYGQRRLAYIESTLGTQAQIEAQGDVIRKATEQASIQARIDAYHDLAKGYAAVVGELQTQWQREMQLFHQGNENIKAQERDVQATILNLKRLGMTEREKLRSQELERDAAVRKFEAEAAKGKQADEKELNRLYGDAIKLVNGVAEAKAGQAKDSAARNGAISDGEKALNKLWETQKSALETIGAQHKANADILLPSLEAAKGKLTEVNQALNELDKKLSESKQLRIDLDQSSVSSAQATINALTAPAVKVITIQTVQGSSAEPAAVQSQGHATGGLISAFANGGKLPGYGGGDTVPAMLEPGEFIINKAATAKTLPLLELINNGKLPGYAEGGLVEQAFETGFEKSLDAKLVQFINSGIVATTSAGDWRDYHMMDQILRDIKTAISRAPQSIQPKMQAKVAEKLSGILGNEQWSLNMATDNQFDPLAVTQNTPNLIGNLQTKIRYIQDALKSFGGPNMGGAYLGGFDPLDPIAGRFLTHASPSFAIPGATDFSARTSGFDFSGRFNAGLSNAMAPVSALAAQTPASSTQRMPSTSDTLEVNLNWGGGKRVKLYGDKADKSDIHEIFSQLDEARRSSQ